jgi:hypothetical protein
VEAKVVMERDDPTRSRGFGFVTFRDPETAQKVLPCLFFSYLGFGLGFGLGLGLDPGPGLGLGLVLYLSYLHVTLIRFVLA